MTTQQQQLFETEPPKPPCKYTLEFLADFQALLKKHNAAFVAYRDDGKLIVKFMSNEAVDGKVPILVWDVERFANEVNGGK